MPVVADFSAGLARMNDFCLECSARLPFVNCGSWRVGLDGSRASPIDHTGKSAVALEFRVTWCRPCKSALDLHGKAGIHLHKKRSRFLYGKYHRVRELNFRVCEKKTGLTIPAALDRTGTLEEQFLLEAVPSCVFIGKDGSIQAIHVGDDRRLARQFEDELVDLTKGKNLARDIKLPTARKRSTHGWN